MLFLIPILCVLILVVICADPASAIFFMQSNNGTRTASWIMLLSLSSLEMEHKCLRHYSWGLDTLLGKNLRILFDKWKHFGKSVWFLGGKIGLEL